MLPLFMHRTRMQYTRLAHKDPTPRYNQALQIVGSQLTLPGKNPSKSTQSNETPRFVNCSTRLAAVHPAGQAHMQLQAEALPHVQATLCSKLARSHAIESC